MAKNTICSISEAKVQVKNMVQTYLLKDENGNHVIPQNQQDPMLLLGPPGIGKTQMAAQVASEKGIGFVSYSLAHHTRNSLLGLPVIVSGEDGKGRHTEYTMSELIASVEEQRKAGFENGIMLFDEFSCMSETIMPAMLSLLQQKRLGTYRLPEGWIILLASNPAEYNRSVKKLDMATLDRIRVISIEPDVDSFLKYARENGIHEKIIGFISAHRGALYYYDTEHPDFVVTPRGWSNLSLTLKANEILSIETDYRTIRGYIRNDKIASAFYEYLGNAGVLPDSDKLSDIFKNGRGASFDECIRKVLLTQAETDKTFVVNNICDFAIGKADETIVKYGIRSNKAAQGLENIFDFLKEAELRNGTGFMKYQKLLADKICGYEKLVKYASFITIPSYVRALEMDFNLYAG